MSVVYTTINGRLIQQVKGGQVTKFVSDTLGSVVAEVDDTGQITHTADYWPYGEVRTETGTKKSPFGFVGVLGYMKDFADALYVRARYLRTKLARWQTVDPLWPDELAYVYVWDRPNQMSDLEGLAPISKGSCTVKICDQYKLWGRYYNHTFICATFPGGGSCSGGLSYDGPGDTGLDCFDALDGSIRCITWSTDCNVAKALCACLKSAKEFGGFIVPVLIWIGNGLCIGYAYKMLGCAYVMGILLRRFYTWSELER